MAVLIPPCPAIIPVPWHPSIGIFIGVIGFAGVVLPLIRNRLGKLETAAWVAAFSLFLMLEIWAIHQEDIKGQRDHAFSRCEEERRFLQMNNDLSNSIETAQDVLRSIENIGKTTKEVAQLARENLEDVTGAGAFAYVLPWHGNIDDGSAVLALNVYNGSNRTLLGAVVTIREVIRGDISLNGVGRIDTRYPSYSPSAIEIGSLAPYEGRGVPLPGGLITPVLKEDGLCVYRIFISSQAPLTTEYLYFKRADRGTGFAYRYDTYIFSHDKHHRGDVYIKNSHVWARNVKHADWVEPMPQ